MTDKTHWKRLVNPDYIGAYAIPEGEDLTVRIDFVQVEEVHGAQGKKDMCTVAHLKGQKPMILNVTNSKSIAKLYGPYIEDWAGKPITLFASTTRLAGETVECLRIRPKVAERKPQQISDERLGKAIEAIKAATYTTAELRKSFVLSEQQEAKLVEALSEANA
jgi:hypothetical protein